MVKHEVVNYLLTNGSKKMTKCEYTVVWNLVNHCLHYVNLPGTINRMSLSLKQKFKDEKALVPDSHYRFFVWTDYR